MKKHSKYNLSVLKVKSFVTTINNLDQIKSGHDTQNNSNNPSNPKSNNHSDASIQQC